MSGRRTKTAILGAMVCAMAVPAMAGTKSQPTVQNLQAQIASLRTQMAQMQQKQDQNWLNQKRREQVKQLIKSVLNDAKTRSSMLQEGQMAGISEDGKIFLRSADGSFEFSPSGELQVRYIYNHRDNGGHTSHDENVQGFQLRRARFIGQGHIASPKIGYYFQLSSESGSYANNVSFQDYYLDYHFNNGLTARAGRFKQPFSREYLTSAMNQLAVERSMVDRYFAVARSEGVELSYKNDSWLFRGAVNNGSEFTQYTNLGTGYPYYGSRSASNGSFTDFNGTGVDYALTGRVDYKLCGDWSELADSFNAWSGDAPAVFLGGAVDWEAGQTGNTSANNDLLKWTADASIQQNRMSAFAAVYGKHAYNEIPANTEDYGLEAQVGYFIVPDEIQPFVRYEGLFLGKHHGTGTMTRNVNMITVGFNWYQHKQNAKFTLDGVYAFNPLDNVAATNIADAGAGFQSDQTNQSGQFAIRAQYQLMF